MTNQENPFPQMSNKESWPPKPSVSLEEFLKLEEEQLEAITGGGGCLGCLRSGTPANVIRTPAGKPARSVVDAFRGWEHEHLTPEAKRTATWHPKSIETNGRTYWVKDPIPS